MDIITGRVPPPARAESSRQLFKPVSASCVLRTETDVANENKTCRRLAEETRAGAGTTDADVTAPAVCLIGSYYHNLLSNVVCGPL